MSSIEIKNLFVASENRDTNLYPYGNTYTLHLTTPIKEIKKVELVYASIPNTIYNITDGSNIIAFSNLTTSYEPNSANLTYFSIPVGFYNASGLAFEIQNAVSNITGISVTYLANEGKFLISRPTTPFSMYIVTPELAKVLGFSTTNVIPSSNVATPAPAPGLIVPLYCDNSRYRDKNFIKSDKLVDLNVDEGIFLDIKELRTPLNQGAVSILQSGNSIFNSSVIDRTFGMIPTDVPTGSIKRFKQSSDYNFEVTYPYPIQRLDRLTISWVDIRGNTVNFNGYDDNSFLLKLYSERKNIT